MVRSIVSLPVALFRVLGSRVGALPLILLSSTNRRTGICLLSPWALLGACAGTRIASSFIGFWSASKSHSIRSRQAPLRAEMPKVGRSDFVRTPAPPPIPRGHCFSSRVRSCWHLFLASRRVALARVLAASPADRDSASTARPPAIVLVVVAVGPCANAARSNPSMVEPKCAWALAPRQFLQPWVGYTSDTNDTQGDLWFQAILLSYPGMVPIRSEGKGRRGVLLAGLCSAGMMRKRTARRMHSCALVLAALLPRHKCAHIGFASPDHPVPFCPSHAWHDCWRSPCRTHACVPSSSNATV